MARRSDHSRDEIKAMAIASGKELIVEEGLAGFSIRKVAKEIGYTVGTLYNVFESHDDLLLHINATTLDDIEIYLSKKLNNKLAAKEAIASLAAKYLQFAKEHYHQWSALFEHQLPADMPLPEWYAQRINQLFTIIEQPILPLVRNDTKAAKCAAQTIWASIHGICTLGLSGKLDVVGVESIQLLTDSLIENYLSGLKGGLKA